MRRDDPFDDFFQEIERMMNDVMRGEGNVEFSAGGGLEAGADMHVDVHESDGELRVVADVPGVEKDDIALQCDGTVLTIDASGPEREYHRRLTLPSRVDEHSATATYNNGVLEVTFEAAEEASDIDVE